MSGWRTATIVLALVCGLQRYQSCTRTPTVVDHTSVETRTLVVGPGEASANTAVADSKPAKTTLFGLHPPAWAMRLLPQPGEKLSAYRDRIVPLAQIAIAPQRARVARLRDTFDEPQRTALDAAVAKTASDIEERVTRAVLDGELQPSTFRPMTGVSMARELLDSVDRGNAEFVGALTQEQRNALAAKHFDFADYLVFATRWEDALPHN